MGEIERIRFDGVNWVPAPPAPGQVRPDVWATGFSFITAADRGPDGALYYVQRSPGLVGRIGRGMARPGNGSDVALELRVGAEISPGQNLVHSPSVGDVLTWILFAPRGRNFGAPLLFAADVGALGRPTFGFALPGDPSPSVWLDPQTTSVILDGFSNPASPTSPRLLPQASFVGPIPILPIFAGLGLEMTFQLFALDFAVNSVGVGSSHAHVLRFP